MNKATKQLSKSLAIIVILTFVITSAIPAGAISVSPNSVSARVGSKVETTKNTSTNIINKVKETTKKVLDSVGIVSEKNSAPTIEESNETIANRLVADPRLDFRTKDKVELSLEMNTLDREVLLDIEKSLEGTVTSPNFYNEKTNLNSIANIGDHTFTGGTGFSTTYGGERSSYEGFDGWTIAEIESYDSNYIVVTGAGNDDALGEVAIYDGESWNFYDLEIPDGMIFMVTESSLVLSRNDIYVGGAGGAIYHYDGSDWEIQNSYPEGHTSIRRFIKTETGQIYAVADGAIIWKKEVNNSWTPIDVSCDGFLSVHGAFDWDAYYYNGKIYFVSDNNVGRVSLLSYNISSGETSILVESLDPQKNRSVYSMYVESEDAIYMTGSTHDESAERGTVLVFKYDGENVNKIIGDMCENLGSNLLSDIKKDPIRNEILWVAGSEGVLGTINMNDNTLTMEPIDLNGDGARNTDDWFCLTSVSPRLDEMYLAASFFFPNRASVMKFGEVAGPQIGFKNLKSVYKSGEEMDVSLEIDNFGGNYEEVDVYIAMEIPGDPNLYYFWPTWSEGLNKKNIRLASGEITDESVLHFTLPDSLPAFGPVNLYAILTAPGNFGIFSNIEVGQFSLAP